MGFKFNIKFQDVVFRIGLREILLDEIFGSVLVVGGLLNSTDSIQMKAATF